MFLRHQIIFYILFIGLCTISCSSNSTSTTSNGEKNKIITITEGTNMACSISPDGNSIVIDLQGTLWLLDSDGGKAKELTDHVYDARQPKWSPDSKRITFQGYKDGNWHIYIINNDGSNLQKITSGQYDFREPIWSPDGHTIACSSDSLGSYDIWNIDISNNQLTQITSNPFEEYGPHYNQDGSKILYARLEGEETFIEEISITSGSINSIYSTENTIAGLAYSKDNHLIYFNESSFSFSRLVQFDLLADRSSPHIISDKDEDVFPFPISWVSEDVCLYTSSGKIWKQDFSKNQKTNIPFTALFELDMTSRDYQRKVRTFDLKGEQSTKGIYQPVLSPHGNLTALIAHGDVWISTRDGITNRITDDEFIQLSPAFSNSGRLLAYASDLNDQPAIWIYDLQTRSHKFITNTQGTAAGIDWLPDDSGLVYTLNFGPRNGTLWHLDLSANQSIKIGKSFPFSLSGPSCSPDGKWITVSILQPYSKLYREGINRIIYAAMGGTTTKSAAHTAHTSFGMRGNDGPRWSPDGANLAFISSGYLWTIKIDENGKFIDEPVQITTELSDAPSWAKDGQNILFQTPTGLKTININDRTTIAFEINIPWEADYPSKAIAIKAGAIFNGIDKELLLNKDIIISNNRIVSIEDHNPDRSIDEWIDASDKYVMPGLIDIHAHQLSSSGASLGRKWLSWGVTSTRDPATDPYDALNRKEAMQSGSLVGPRIFYTGSPLDGTRVYYGGTYALQNKNQLALELDRAVKLDYDFIKTYVRLSDQVQNEIVSIAHANGLPVYSHELYPAASYGVDGVEHILGTSRRGYSPKMTASFKSYDDATSIIAESGMSFTPTIGIYVGYDYVLSKDPSVLEDKRLLSLEPEWVINAGRASVERVFSDKGTWERNFQNAASMIRDIHQKGGLIVSGTDGPILPFGFGLHIELEAYQLAGLSPFEVLQTATVNGAKVLGAEDDLGSIEPGKLADLLILNANPLADVRNVRKIEKVLLNGRPISVDSLL